MTTIDLILYAAVIIAVFAVIYMIFVVMRVFGSPHYEEPLEDVVKRMLDERDPQRDMKTVEEIWSEEPFVSPKVEEEEPVIDRVPCPRCGEMIIVRDGMASHPDCGLEFKVIK